MAERHNAIDIEAYWPAADAEEAETLMSPESAATQSRYAPVPNDDDVFDFDDSNDQLWFTHASPLKARSRPSYEKMCVVMKEKAKINIVMGMYDGKGDYSECMKILNAAGPRHCDHKEVSQIMAAQSQNDLNWNQVLAGENRDLAIEALEKEMESLTSTI